MNIATRIMKNGAETIIVSGEGDGPGTEEIYSGTLTKRAIMMRLKIERCGGDRWAYAKAYLCPGEAGMRVFIDLETGEYVS